VSEAPTQARDKALEAFLGLIAEKGYVDVSLRAVAEAAGLGFADVYRLYPNKLSLAAAFMARIDAEVMAGTPSSTDPEETPRDRLFDVMMRRYDALRPHRAALRALRRAGTRDPMLAIAMGPPLRRSMAAMLEAASVASDGLPGALRQNGLLAIHYAVSRVFDRDETQDLSKTMAALDNRLKTAERWSQLFDRYVKSPDGSVPPGPEVSPEA
jgi:AcrR family transcriptional regulator